MWPSTVDDGWDGGVQGSRGDKFLETSALWRAVTWGDMFGVDCENATAPLANLLTDDAAGKGSPLGCSSAPVCSSESS